MATAIDVVKYIRSQLDPWGETQLQKLVYYSQAWALVWEGRKLVDEPFEAWINGPVVRRLRYRWTADWAPADPEALPDPDRRIVDAVLAYYGQMNGGQLSQRTHDEEPWLEARGDLAPDANGHEKISETTMLRFHSRQALSGDAPRRVSQVQDANFVDVLGAAKEGTDIYRGALALLAQQVVFALTVDQAIAIHDLDSDAPLRDRGGLEGILAAPFAGFGDVEFFPSLTEKSAKYLEGFATNQVFADGNKRTGWLCAHSFLRVNGLCLDYIPDEVIEKKILDLIAHAITFGAVVVWLDQHVIFPGQTQSTADSVQTMTSPEPPTVIETFVKAAIKGATAIPVVGSGLSAAAQVVYDDVRARRVMALTEIPH